MTNRKTETRRPHYVGIDYSMTTPAVCVCYNEKFHFKHCVFFYLTKEKSKLKNEEQFFSPDILNDDFSCDEERFLKIAMWAECMICPPARPKIFIENYSFASKGQVFHIGENTGLLKHRLFVNRLEFELLAPGTIKKFATGKGNAKKPEMLEAFKKETGFDLEAHFDVQHRKNKSPAADIADSYFICALGASGSSKTD